MECCIGASTETVLQIVKCYTVVKRILKLTFQTVCSPLTKDYSLKFFSLQWKT